MFHPTCPLWNFPLSPTCTSLMMIVEVIRSSVQPWENSPVQSQQAANLTSCCSNAAATALYIKQPSCEHHHQSTWPRGRNGMRKGWTTFKKQPNQEDRCDGLLSEMILGHEAIHHICWKLIYFAKSQSFYEIMLRRWADPTCGSQSSSRSPT